MSKKLLAVALLSYTSGLSTVLATPMTWGDFLDYRELEDPKLGGGLLDAGYLVESTEKPLNDERHKGYVYWVEKNKFEKEYNKAILTTESEIEQEIQNKGLSAPRLTPEHIDSVILSEHYFTAADGERFAQFGEQYATVDVPKPLECLTFCVLVLKNGLTVTGESACVSPENFDAEIGRKTAYENARNKIWLLEGYLLKDKLHIKQEWQAEYQHEQLAGIDRKIGLADIGEDPVADVDTLQGGSLGSVGCASSNNVWIQQENTSVLLAIASNPVFSGCIRKKAEDKLSKWLDQID